jgi:hypothetical protein
MGEESVLSESDYLRMVATRIRAIAAASFELETLERLRLLADDVERRAVVTADIRSPHGNAKSK